MALFIDGTISELSDVAAHDSSVLDIANNESIDLSAKLDIAQMELHTDLILYLDAHAPACSITGVLIDDRIRRWHQMKTLELVYRDAYFSQLNDRYDKRWQLWKDLSERARCDAFDAGIPFHDSPIPRPALPVLQVNEGACLPSTYSVRTCCVADNGEESAPSAAAVLKVDAPHRLTVKLGTPPPRCKTWRIYAGTMSGVEQLQASVPVSLTAEWNVPVDGLTSGPRPGKGQSPTRILRRRRTLPGGH